jgi:hypothetical protein
MALNAMAKGGGGPGMPGGSGAGNAPGMQGAQGADNAPRNAPPGAQQAPDQVQQLAGNGPPPGAPMQ